jgi:hypothetical protein
MDKAPGWSQKTGENGLVRSYSLRSCAGAVKTFFTFYAQVPSR